MRNQSITIEIYKEIGDCQSLFVRPQMPIKGLVILKFVIASNNYYIKYD